jgi:thiosulfate/3-mercaptopyruvate sulfurtransferase
VNVVLVDVRPREAYDAGHIPGAIHLDTETELSTIGADAAVGGRHPLPDDAKLERIFGAAGIGPESLVVARDHRGRGGARCWWLLRHVGHDAAGSLDVRTYVGPLATEPAETEPAPFRARPRSDDTIEAEEILERLGDSSLTLFDARSRVRWLGEEEPLDPVAGRIPGARSAPFDEPLPTDAAAAPGPVAYCGSGVSAAVIAQKLIVAGRDDVRLYPGSFSEWCRRPGYPIQKGLPPS